VTAAAMSLIEFLPGIGTQSASVSYQVDKMKVDRLKEKSP